MSRVAHSVHSTSRSRITGKDSKDSGIRIGNKKCVKNTFQLFSFQNDSQKNATSMSKYSCTHWYDAAVQS